MSDYRNRILHCTPQALAENEAAVQLICAAQRIAGSRCLHTDFEVSASMYAAEKVQEISYVLLFADEARRVPQAVIGAEYRADLKRAWLRGPFFSQDVTTDADTAVCASAVFAALRDALGARVNVWDGYLETAHHAVIAWYQSHGFVAKARHSVYTVLRDSFNMGSQQDAAPPANNAVVDEIVSLANASFPGGYLTRAQFAAPASDAAITLALVDGQGLLGYVYASYEPGAIEAYVDNLAVAPRARRSGVGRKLLNAALHWAFQLRNAPQVALVVREGNTNAATLYQSVGFTLMAEGVHVQLRSEVEGV